MHSELKINFLAKEKNIPILPQREKISPNLPLEGSKGDTRKGDGEDTLKIKKKGKFRVFFGCFQALSGNFHRKGGLFFTVKGPRNGGMAGVGGGGGGSAVGFFLKNPRGGLREGGGGEGVYKES